MNRFFAITVALILGAPAAFAERYERQGNFILKVTPYKELLSSQEGIKVTAKVAQQVLVNVMGSLKEKNLIPDSIATREDLERYRKAQVDVDSLVDYLNDFVKEQRSRGTYFESADLAPSALIFFGGKKFSLNWGTGAGASASLGLVMMPVKIEKFDVVNKKKVDEFVSMRFSTVLWPSADVGFGVGGGARARVGVGFIWDLTHEFSYPDEFWGAGPGLSWSPVVIGAGINLKVGVISNNKLSGWVDFLYAAAALEFGPTVELGSPRINVTTVMSGPAIMSYFDKASQDAYMSTLKDISNRMDDWMRERGPQIPGTSDGKDDKSKKKTDGPGVDDGPNTHRPS